MGNFYLDNDDLRFYVERYIDWKTLVEAVERNFTAADAPANVEEAVETYKEIIGLFGQFVADEVAPVSAKIDSQGTHLIDGKIVHPPEFDAIFEQLKEMGVHGLTLPRELGGMNAPAIIYFIACELFARADVTVMNHFGFHTGIASTLMQYSLKEGSTKFDEKGHITETRWGDAIAEIVAGEAWGSMDLTEPGAGSDLSALRSKARKDDEGNWRVTGNKVFITSGHGKYHLVLAKTKDEESLDAISLFMVPLTIEKEGETVVNAFVDRLEEKIGHHGSATCSVQFEDSLGDLVGKEGEGFRYMLMLMNNARIGVGFESLATCEEAFRVAKEYAAERKSMGKTIDKHEMIHDYLEEMEETIVGIRALAMDAAVCEELAFRYEMMAKLPAHAAEADALKKKAKKNGWKARMRTPVLKYVASEAAVWTSRMSMQILGGNGYMKDYPAEKLMRDSLVLPVYEGTSQIQALMVLKDHLAGAMKKPQRFLRKLAMAKLNAVKASDELDRRFHAIESLAYSAQQHILLKIAKRKWSEALDGPLPDFFDRFTHMDPKRDFSYGLLHAERLTRILSDVMIAETLVKQAKQFPERRIWAERWIDRVEPRVRYNWDLVVHTGQKTLERLRASEGLGGEAPAEEHHAPRDAA
ncbi:MAG: acyl-CoA dehydrogenase family protein [Deltaproteobacteria bacterium]|nr:acyl-CoA dehydrogenase family protein [Deltaproteobacteria bacterium]